MPTSVLPARRAWLAVLAVLALLGVGAPAAHAAAPGTISGTVSAPAGVELSAVRIATRYRLADGRWLYGSFVPVNADGTYTFTGLTDGTDYVLEVSTAPEEIVRGFYAGPGKPLVRLVEDAQVLRAPADGVDLALQRGHDLDVTVTLPPGFPWQSPWDTAPRAVQILVEELGPDGSGPVSTTRSAVLGPQDGGRATVRGLRQDATYRVSATDTHLSFTPRFSAGYYRAGTAGLVPQVNATLVRAGQKPTVTISWILVPPRVRALAAPTLQGAAAGGASLSVTTGTWDPAEATVSYTWLRDGAPIPGATAATYRVTPADAGSRLAVRVTSSAQDHTPITVTTAEKRIPLGATAAPKVSGTARLGRTLRAVAPRWQRPSGVQTRYQWLRGGKVVKGATGATYTLGKADVGTKISVRATGVVAGAEVATVTSAATKKVAKGRPTVTLSSTKLAAGRRATVTVKVKAPAVSRPTGKVTVTVGAKKVSAKLTATRKGSVKVRLPKLAKGRHKVTVRFAPSGSTKKYAATVSKKLTLRAR